jgi:hypothetical protein
MSISAISLILLPVEQKIVSSDQWMLINIKQDLIAVLTMIQDATHQHDEVKGGMIQVVEQDIRLFVCEFQYKNQSIIDYYKLFKAQMDVINVHGGCFGYHPSLYQKKLVEMKANMTLMLGATGYDDVLVAVKCKECNAYREEYRVSLFQRIVDSN